MIFYMMCRLMIQTLVVEYQKWACNQPLFRKTYTEKFHSHVAFKVAFILHIVYKLNYCRVFYFFFHQSFKNIKYFKIAFWTTNAYRCYTVSELWKQLWTHDTLHSWMYIKNSRHMTPTPVNHKQLPITLKCYSTNTSNSLLLITWSVLTPALVNHKLLPITWSVLTPTPINHKHLPISLSIWCQHH